MNETLVEALKSLTPHLPQFMYLGGGALALGLLALLTHFLLGLPAGFARWPGLLTALVGVFFGAVHVVAKQGSLPLAVTLVEGKEGQSLVVPYLQIAASLIIPGILIWMIAGNRQQR